MIRALWHKQHCVVSKYAKSSCKFPCYSSANKEPSLVIIGNDNLLKNIRMNDQINMKNELLRSLISLAENHGLKTKFYIDRLTVYFDSRASVDDINKLVDLAEKNMLTRPCTLEGHIHLSQKVELFQLDEKALELLHNICQSSGDYKFNYIELALDFYSKKMSNAENANLFFNKHLVHKRNANDSNNFYHHIHNGEDAEQGLTREYDTDGHGTQYYSPKRDKIRFLMYDNKKFRWDDRYSCVHLEYRYVGLDKLKKLGIITVKDLISFDHFSHWQQRLNLRKPNIKAIGEQIGKNNNVSTQALNTRGNRFFNHLTSLQEYLQDNPEHFELFPALNTEEALAKFFTRCFPAS